MLIRSKITSTIQISVPTSMTVPTPRYRTPVVCPTTSASTNTTSEPVS
jgi:hypothetical protein